MCSIGGWVSRQPLPYDLAHKLAAGLLYYGKSRGSQSGGIFANGIVCKAATDPLDITGMPQFREALSPGASYCLTHTRQPTSGGRGNDQAQPFVRDNTVTVHNGMFANCEELKTKFNLRKESGVDSELVTDYVETYGVKKLPEFMRAVHGNAALAIWKRHPESDHGRIYLCRDGNPLEHLTLKLHGGNSVTVFASTEEMLEKAMRYTWLYPPTLRTKTLPWQSLCLVKPSGVKVTGIKAETKSYSRGHRVEYWDQETNTWSPTRPADKPAHGNGVSKWTPKRDTLTPAEETERQRILNALGWRDDCGLSLESLRRTMAARLRWDGKRYSGKTNGKPFKAVPMPPSGTPKAAALERYFKALRETKTPDPEALQAYQAWRKETLID